MLRAHGIGLGEVMTVPGVGPITATAYVATIDDPKRFRSSDQVAAYLGLAPSVAQSGELEVHGHITKEGDGMLRSYLVEAAHVLLTRKRGTSRLKQWGLKLAKKKGHGKARVAVARKIAVLLHHPFLDSLRRQEPDKHSASSRGGLTSHGRFRED